MRYFLTSNATRGYYAGGFSFTFEPTAMERGTWHGVLATDGQSADALAAAAYPQVSEITEEQFNEEKKKGQQSPVSRMSAPVLPKSSLVREVAAAAVAVATTSKSADPVPVTPKSSGGLRTTSATPPEEPLLVQSPRARSTKK
jgi:hypothetical protein